MKNPFSLISFLLYIDSNKFSLLSTLLTIPISINLINSILAKKGAELNNMLGSVSRFMLIHSCLLVIGILLSITLSGCYGTYYISDAEYSDVRETHASVTYYDTKNTFEINWSKNNESDFKSYTLYESDQKIINNDDLKGINNSKVLIRAHGEPPSTYELAVKNNLTLIDASCPVVLKLQNRIKKSYDKNEAIYIYGKHGHPEVKGLRGQTKEDAVIFQDISCLLYTSPSPRDGLLSRMPSSA